MTGKHKLLVEALTLLALFQLSWGQSGGAKEIMGAVTYVQRI